MNALTIDTLTAKRMVAASAIQGASIIGQPGGWSVILKTGLQERPLGAQRSDKPRAWRSLDRAVAYLKRELQISRFDLLDATLHTEGEPLVGKSREHAAQRLRQAHAAAVPITGIQTTGVVRCDQPRVLDLASRHGRKVDALPDVIMDEVLARLATLFE